MKTQQPEENGFNGDKKIGRSLLSGAEIRLKRWLIPKIPQAVETYHLTMATLVWSVVNVVTAFFCTNKLSLLWIVSLMIILQYLTDLLDGELGRQRKTGLLRWGFYMDHFLDFLFLSSLVFAGYMISPPGLQLWSIALFVLLASFMVNSFLSFAATNAFTIYFHGMGPTEGRFILLLINTYIIYFGTGHFHFLLPLSVVFCLGGLIINTYQIQKKLWNHDMYAKQQQSRTELFGRSCETGTD